MLKCTVIRAFQVVNFVRDQNWSIFLNRCHKLRFYDNSKYSSRACGCWNTIFLKEPGRTNNLSKSGSNSSINFVISGDIKFLMPLCSICLYTFVLQSFSVKLAHRLGKQTVIEGYIFRFGFSIFMLVAVPAVVVIVFIHDIVTPATQIEMIRHLKKF